MVHVQRTFTVTKPVEQVVAYLADFAHAEAWDPGTQSCTRVGADGPVVVGTTWHNVSEVMGAETELEYTLTELTADHIVLVGKNKTATSTDDITVRPHADGAEVVYDSTIEFNGAAKLATPIAKIEFEHLGNKTVEGIQDAVSKL